MTRPKFPKVSQHLLEVHRISQRRMQFHKISRRVSDGMQVAVQALFSATSVSA